MEIQTELERGEIHKTYTMFKYNHHGSFRLFFFGVVIAIFLLIAFMTVSGGMQQNAMPDPTLVIISFFAFALALCILIPSLIRRTRIVVRSHGLEIHNSFNDLFGMNPHKFIRWDNLSSLYVVVKVVNNGEGSSIVYIPTLMQASGPDVSIGQIISLPYVKYFTGGWFNRKHYGAIDPNALVQTEFGQDLLTYAPQVIEATRQEKRRVEALEGIKQK